MFLCCQRERGSCKTQQAPESQQPRGNAEVGSRAGSRDVAVRDPFQLLASFSGPSWVRLGEEGDTSFSNICLWIPTGCSPSPLSEDFGEQNSLCPGCDWHMCESLPRHGDNHRDMSGTGVLGRNFGDFSFHGLTAAFLCSF